MTFSLPARDRILLQGALLLVPAADREEWMLSWYGELWHRRHPRERVICSTTDLYPGLVRDAVWLRTESVRRTLSGTALLCVLIFTVLTAITFLPLLWLMDFHALAVFFTQNSVRFLCQAVLVTMVGLGTRTHHIERASASEFSATLRGTLFLCTKILLALLAALFLSNDATLFFHASYPLTSDTLQSQLFVIGALLGLRWSFEDSDARCKQCLHALGPAVRVGPPSRNFLDSNGLELICGAGHGFLSVPEIETSWRGGSRWIVPDTMQK